MNKTAMNNHVKVFVKICVFLLCEITTSEIVMPYGSGIFN
jgi:hypothetical protein